MNEHFIPVLAQLLDMPSLRLDKSYHATIENTLFCHRMKMFLNFRDSDSSQLFSPLFLDSFLLLFVTILLKISTGTSISISSKVLSGFNRWHFITIVFSVLTFSLHFFWLDTRPQLQGKWKWWNECYPTLTDHEVLRNILLWTCNPWFYSKGWVMG